MLLFGIYVLSEDPLVISMPDIGVPVFTPWIPERLRPHYLVFPTWTKEPFPEVLKSAWKLRSLRKSRLTWMCSTPREARRLSMAGFRTLWCHQNLYCNECSFEIQPREKKYDAIYTAAIEPYKRIHLAAKIPSLCIISRSPDARSKLDALGMSHAHCNEQSLGPMEVCKAINESRCGLALSAKEGGMLAFTEYLLCGLPVVSTPSIGGRHVFIDETNTRMVRPDADAVAAAVRRFAEEPVDPEAMRAGALRRIREFRAILADKVASITGERPFDPDAADGMWFLGRFVSRLFIEELMHSHTGSRFERPDLVGRLG